MKGDLRPQVRVLVVDDEPGLAELVALWLEGAHYETSFATNAAEALEALSSNDLDVLFTDVSMPGGMDGFELAREATRRWPHLRVAFGSAHAWELHDKDSEWPMLRKPYTPAQVIETIRRVCARGGVPPTPSPARA